MKDLINQTVVCIASGSSLNQVDCDMVKKSGFFTISVNSSWKMARFCNEVYGGDLAWWDANVKGLNIPADRWTCSRQASFKHGLKLHRATGDYNSGMRAIQLAMERGAARVILIGYDCSVENGTHWHGDHKNTKNPDEARCKRWLTHFIQVSVIAHALKVEIINCSRKTAIKSFRTGDLKEELDKAASKPILIRGMYGLGDGIYQRGFVKKFPGAYIITPWPELYSDLDVKCVKPDTRLRTQAKNVSKTKIQWHGVPRSVNVKQISYGHREFESGSIVSAMRNCFRVDPDFDLPDFGESPIKSDKPVAIVRPVTIRREWLNSARAPDPKYVNEAAKILKAKGFHVVSIADLQDGQEWLVGDAPEADEYYHNGELSVTQLLAAVQNAAVVVGGVGWIVPACIASGTPLYVVLGGNGMHNAPEKITDSEHMDLSKVGWAKPVNFCMCHNNKHECEKTINGFNHQFRKWLREMQLSK